MTLETVDIIRDLVANWKIRLKISAVTDNGDGTFTILVCNTFYAQTGRPFTIYGITYTVISFVKDTSMVISGGVAPFVGTYNLKVPFYFHGTLLDTNTKLTGIMQMDAKTPMVYLRRPYRDQFEAEDSAVERTVTCVIYFLCEDGFEEYDIDQRDTECIKPMRSMAYAFVDMLKSNSQIAGNLIDAYTIEDKLKFGIYTEKGVEKAYWDTNVSGCELNIDIPVNRNYECNC